MPPGLVRDDLEQDGGGGGGYQPPDFESGDWARIADLVSGRTDYRSVNFAAQEPNVSLNLAGVYSISGVTVDTITLADPAAVNDDWNDLTTTAYASPSLSTQGEGWVGPFIIDHAGMTEVVCNFIAPQGMYLVTDKGKDRAWEVTMRVEITPINALGVPTGAMTFHLVTIKGHGRDKSAKAVTLRAPVAATDRVSLRARRTTYKDLDSSHTIVDECKWRDAYATSPVDVPHFGNITTIYSRTYATSGATAVKERRLNCIAKRKVLVRNMDNTFGPGLAASNNAADIICHMALDPFIGGRSQAELDVEQIYETLADAEAYFGTPLACQFNYTFDQENISFEEMVQTVAQAVFCTAYRNGSELRLFFERETEDSTLLFNHRNKVPGSEKRTVRFGNVNDHDGVELDYISPIDGAKLTLYRPEDRSAVKPKKTELLGVRSDEQATLHIDRMWNKLRFQHTVAEFDALAEATQLVLNERIEVTDNTRPDVLDGYIVTQDGLSLELSQPFVTKPGLTYSIFIQRPDGGLDVLPVQPGASPMFAVLQQPPTFAINLDPDLWADVTYQIVSDSEARTSGFLLTEKGAYDKRRLGIQAINYDARYYQDDLRYNT